MATPKSNLSKSNTEWPKVITLLACFAASSYIEVAEAKSVKSFQDDWKVLCIEHSLDRCPTLNIFPYRLQDGLGFGRTSCGYRKWDDGRKERECFSVEVWRNAPPDVLEHEMAHVLQWLGGDNEVGHGRSFRRTYLQSTGRSPLRRRWRG